MLILARYKNERIKFFYKEIEITLQILQINPKRQQVRLGFDAPKVVQIVREELINGTSTNNTHCAS